MSRRSWIPSVAAIALAGCFSAPEPAPPRSDEAATALSAGIQAESKGCLELAQRHFERSMREAMLGGLVAGTVEARLALARLSAATGDGEGARSLLWRAMMDARDLGREDLRVRVLVQQAYAEGLGGENAGRLLNDALVTCRSNADAECGPVLNVLGQQARRNGDANVARQHFADALAANESAGRLSAQADNRMNLGLLDEESGKPQSALQHYERALELDRKAGHPAGMGGAREGMMRVTAQSGDPEAQLRHGLAAMDLWEALGRTGRAAEIGALLATLDLPSDEKARLERRVGTLKSLPPFSACE